MIRMSEFINRWHLKNKNAFTVAILAQGASWAVAVMQAFSICLKFKIELTSQTSMRRFA